MRKSQITFLGLMLIVLLCFSTSYANGTTIVVPDDYATIQAAVTAANPNETILVKPGIYNENVVINKNVTVKAAPGYGAHVNGGTDSAFYITGVDAIVEGFQAYGQWWDIIAVKADGVTIRNNIVIGPGSFTSWMIPNPGPGISVIECQGVHVVGNHILNTTGAGIWMGAARNCTIEDNMISGTQYTGILLAPWWGVTRSGWSAECFGNTIDGNKVASVGNLQWVYDDGIRLGAWAHDNEVMNNHVTASIRDGIRAVGNSHDNHIHDNKIQGNGVPATGGVDARDQSNCITNIWSNNKFRTFSGTCIN